MCKTDGEGILPHGKYQKKHLTLFLMNDMKIIPEKIKCCLFIFTFVYAGESSGHLEFLKQFLHGFTDHILSFMQTEIIQYGRSDHCKGIPFS